MMNFLSVDVGPGISPPVHTTPDAPPSTFEWWILPLILIGIILLIVAIIAIAKKTGHKNSEENDTNEEPKKPDNSEQYGTQLCCPKCHSVNIKYEPETHKNLTHIKAICEDCGNLWILK